MIKSKQCLSQCIKKATEWPGPKVYETSFMLNSAQHETHPADKFNIYKQEYTAAESFKAIKKFYFSEFKVFLSSENFKKFYNLGAWPPSKDMWSAKSTWAVTWDFQQCSMCDQQSLRSACAYAQSDQSLCKSLEYSMTVKLLIEHHLEFLSLKKLPRIVWVYTCQNATLFEITSRLTGAKTDGAGLMSLMI